MFHRLKTYLSVVFAIFWRDIKRLLHNPIALVIVIGVCFMPSLYAWYCIAANWNPYGNTDSLKVAVASSDQGATSSETGQINVGDQVIQKMKDNHELDWQFVDQDTAINGVYSGEYWAALVFPENFSQEFVSVFSGHFTRPTIEYYVDEKPSPVVPKITQTAANTVEKEINEAFVQKVSETVAKDSQKAGAYTKEKTKEASGSLTSSVRKAETAIKQTRKTISSLSDTMKATQTTVQHADDTLATVQTEIPQLISTLDQTKTLLKDVRNTVNKEGSAAAKNTTAAALAISSAASSANEAINTASAKLSAAEADINKALQTAQTAVADNSTALAGLQQLNTSAGDNATVQKAIATLQKQNTDLANTVTALQQASTDLDSTIQAVENAANSVDSTAQTEAAAAQTASSTFQNTILPSITSSLDSLTQACGTLDGVVASLDPAVAEARSILKGLNSTITSGISSLQSSSKALKNMEKDLHQSATDLNALQTSASMDRLTTFLKADPKDIGSFMAAPVELKTVQIYPVKNYGSGVAPFYTNLALWAAGFILMAVVRMRVDPKGLPRFTTSQAYLGRWLFYMVMGLIQALIICVGDLVMTIQCENPAAFIGAGLLTAFVDVNLMYALAYTFRHIGKAFAVILLIMQIPGSSGMYPVEMLPAFFQAINPLLPFTYSIDAMREAIGGFYGLNYLWDMLTLALLFIPAGFLIGMVLGKPAFNLNVLFDKKLRQSDFFMVEQVPQKEVTYRLRPMLHALLNSPDFRARLIARAQKFKRNRRKLLRLGWILLFAQPLITFIVMVALHASVETKVVLLAIMVVGIVLVDAYLIIMAYIDAIITDEMAELKETPDSGNQPPSAGSDNDSSESSPASAAAPSLGGDPA